MILSKSCWCAVTAGDHEKSSLSVDKAAAALEKRRCSSCSAKERCRIIRAKKSWLIYRPAPRPARKVKEPKQQRPRRPRTIVLQCIKCLAFREVVNGGSQAPRCVSCSIINRRKPHWTQPCATCGIVRRVNPKKNPKLCRACSEKSRGGSNNSNWKGGITPLNQKIRHSKEMTAWRKAVFERDKYTCQECGQIGGKLNADHIKSFAKYPALRFELSNGRTLCVPCHKKTPTYLSGARKKSSVLL